MVYTRKELKVPIAKLLEIEDFHDTFIVVNFIKSIYVLFGHPNWITEEERKIMEEAYWDLEMNHCLKD